MTDEITRLQARVKVLEEAGTKMADCIEYGLLGLSDAVRQWDAAIAASQPVDPVTNAGCSQHSIEGSLQMTHTTSDIRPLDEEFDTMMKVERNPSGAWSAIQTLAAQLAAANARAERRG